MPAPHLPETIHTDRLELLPQTLDFVTLVLRGERAAAGELIGAALGAWPSGGELEFGFAGSAATLRADAGAIAWLSRTVVLRDERRVIGSVSLKGRPDAAGQVEIGYGIEPAWRRRGFAREAAGALLTHAFRPPAVRRAVAAIVPSNEPSVRIAEALGLRHTPERTAKYGNGEVLWAITRDTFASSLAGDHRTGRPR
ncbi:MAG: GNAT family N-acetyltransferase [Chloroflexi bacterium]|nr:GNAT family N-acetyltransferase [Chloroflexota bacterium]